MSLFEDTIVYVIIFAVFVLGFMPVMLNWVVQGQAVAAAANDTTTGSILGMVVPLIFIAFIIGFALRAAGKRPSGQW